MKNILIIIPSLIKGGTERTAAKLSVSLAKEFNVYLLVLNLNKGIDYEYGGRLLDFQEFFLKFKGPNKLAVYLNKLWTIKEIKKRFQIEVCISFLEGPNFYNILSRKKEKVFVSVRGHKSSFYKHSGSKWKIEKLSMKLLYPKADSVVAVSEGIKKDLIENFGIPTTKISYIPNYYNTSQIRKLSCEPLEEKFTFIKNYRTIITSGRLSYPKGHKHLLRIFKELSRQQLDSKLIILGEGELYKELTAECSNLNLTYYSFLENKPLNDSFHVYFLGFHANPFNFIKNSKVFLLTSLWEGFPNALAEAMACGIPVVSTDCRTGPREILDLQAKNHESIETPSYTSSGILMPPFTDYEYKNDLYKEWANVVNKFLLEDLLFQKYVKASEQRANEFSEEVVLEKWRNLILS